MKQILIDHWFGVALAFVLGFIGRFLKSRVPQHSTGIVGFYWRTLTLHPILVGAGLCLIPTAPVWSVAAETYWGRGAYGALAGALAVIFYDMARTWGKKRGLISSRESSAPPRP